MYINLNKLGIRTYLKLATGQGLEPRLPGPKPGVLPLDDPVKVTYVTNKSIS